MTTPTGATAAAPTALSTQVYRIYIRAAPEAIWEALTTPEFTGRYFHGGLIDVSNGRRRLTDPDGETVWNDEPIHVQEPPRRFVHGWRSLYDPELAAEDESRVSVEIEPQDGGICLVTLVHDRLEGAPKTARQVVGAGWMYVLSGLKTVLETGAPMDDDLAG